MRKWAQYLCPHEYYESVQAVDLESLWERGIRGLILDLDNTLVKWDEHHVNHELLTWFRLIERIGMKCCILSNNHQMQRIAGIAEVLGVQFLARAGKPRRRPFRTAMHLLGSDRQSTAVVGDQVFTDVLGGRRSGLYTILIQPKGPREFFGTKLVRRFEGGIMRYFIHKGYIKLSTRNG